MKSGDEIKQRYLQTLQKYASYEKELSYKLPLTTKQFLEK